MIRRAALLLLVSAAPSADETLTVQGHRSRFQPAPAAVPNPQFDPPGSENALHDSDTGADLARFGPAYSATTPAPPINPAARSDLQDDPLPAGPPHP